MSTSTYNLNQMILYGSISASKPMSYTQSGTAMLDIGLATTQVSKTVDGKTAEVTVWHNFKLWGKTAERVAKIYAHKTKQKALVVAEGETAEYTDRTGVKKSVYRLNVQRIFIVREDIPTAATPVITSPTGKPNDWDDFGGPPASVLGETTTVAGETIGTVVPTATVMIEPTPETAGSQVVNTDAIPF